ncbi:MAG: hypothetical protein LBR31_09900 [Desulfovibrio sp.]|jgi:hypothetical protein|nr:hypothetical protein [Desulfovibrio sp.]
MYEPVSKPNAVMSMLGSKVASGRDLTMAETLMAYTEVAKARMESYGPSPATMQLKPVPLPEDIRGALANYAGI